MPAGEARHFECQNCRRQDAVRLWIQVFPSIEDAKRFGKAVEFLQAAVPAEQRLMKIQVCLGCQTFRLCTAYTERELEFMGSNAGEVLPPSAGPAGERTGG